MQFFSGVEIVSEKEEGWKKKTVERDLSPSELK